MFGFVIILGISSIVQIITYIFQKSIKNLAIKWEDNYQSQKQILKRKENMKSRDNSKQNNETQNTEMNLNGQNEFEKSELSHF